MTSFLAKIKAFFATPLFNNLRAVLYVALPAWLTSLVAAHKLTQDHATLWTAVAVTALGPALAAVFAPNGWCTYLFLLSSPLQAVLVGIGGFSNNAYGSLLVAVVGSFATSGLAAAHVHRAEPSAAG